MNLTTEQFFQQIEQAGFTVADAKLVDRSGKYCILELHFISGGGCAYFFDGDRQEWVYGTGNGCGGSGSSLAEAIAEARDDEQEGYNFLFDKD